MAYASLDTLEQIQRQIKSIELTPSLCNSSKETIHEISILIDIAKRKILQNDVAKASPINHMQYIQYIPTIKSASDLRLPLGNETCHAF